MASSSPTPAQRLEAELRSQAEAAESKLSQREEDIRRLTAERDNLTRQVAEGGGKRDGWIKLILWLLVAVLAAVVALGFTAVGLRLQGDCFKWDNFGRVQSVCFTATDGFFFKEELPPPSPAPQDPPDEPEGHQPPGATVDPTATDNRASDKERVEIIPANGVEKDEANADAATQPPPPDDDPCDVTLIADLEKYFEYRQWDTKHIAIIENALDQPMPEKDTPVHYRDYEFWGDDGPNLRAFIRDQRFGVLGEGAVIIRVTTESAKTQIRYTIFRCECGITAIYREIKETVVYTPPPKKKYVPKEPLSNEIPQTWCVDPITNVRKDCA